MDGRPNGANGDAMTADEWLRPWPALLARRDLEARDGLAPYCGRSVRC